MDLQELKFKVDSTQVLEAANNLKKLADALNSAIKPMQQVTTVSAEVEKKTAKAAKAVESIGDSAEKAGDKLDPVTKQLLKAQTTLDILSGASIEAADGAIKLGDGFTKMQAGVLASLKLLGATTADLKELSSTFIQLNTITGTNPFDKSASGLFKLQKETQELVKINDYLTRGLNLTKAEVADLARDTVRRTIVYQQEGKTQKELSDAIKKLENDYLSASAKKQKAIILSKQMEDAAKREAQAIVDAENAKKKAEQDAMQAAKDLEDKRKFMFDSRIAFMQEETNRSKAEKDKELKAMGDYYRQLEKLDQQAQRKSSGTTTARATEQPMDAAVSQMYKAREKAARDQAKAADYARSAEERLDNQLSSMSQSMGSTYADRALKYKNALLSMGLSADEVSKRMDAFTGKLNKVADSDRAKQLQYLSRAVSVQMGDVFTSLAGGMNPFLVLIQQGDQLRGIFQQIGADSNELSKSMRGAFGQIISSIVDTGKAVGTFIIGSFLEAGKGINSFIGQVTGLNAAMDAMTAVAARAGVAMGPFRAAMAVVSTIAAGVTAAFVALAAILGGAYLIALYKARQESIELNKQLTLNGASLGLNRDMALDLAKSFDGISQTKAIAVMTEMAKQGGFTRDQIATILPVADKMKSQFGIAISDTIKSFKDLQEKPTENLTKLAIQLGTIPVEILKQVDALERQGKSAQAAQLAMEALAEGQSKAMTNAQVYEDGWTKAANMIAGAWNKAWDAIMGVARPQTLSDQIEQKKKDLIVLTDKLQTYQKQRTPGDEPGVEALRKRVKEAANELDTLRSQQKAEIKDAQDRANESAKAAKFGADKPARDKAADEAKKAQEAYNDAIRKGLSDIDAQVVKTEELTAAEKAKFDVIRGLVDSGVWQKLTNQQRLNVIAIRDDVIAKEAAAKATSDREKAENAYNDSIARSTSALSSQFVKEDQLTKVQKQKFDDINKMVNDGTWALMTNEQRLNTIASWDNAIAQEAVANALAKSRKEDDAKIAATSKIIKMTNDASITQQKYNDYLATLDEMLLEGTISADQFANALNAIAKIKFGTVAADLSKITSEVEKNLSKATANEKYDLGLQASGMSDRDIRIAKEVKQNELEMEQKITDLRQKAQESGKYNPQDLTNEENKIRALYSQRDAWVAIREKQKDVFDQSNKLADAFVNALDAVLVRGESAKDVFDSLAASIRQMIIQLTILEPLKRAMSSTFNQAGGLEGIIKSGANLFKFAGTGGGTEVFGNMPAGTYANGAMFNSGIQKFANGGTFTNSVVSTPTLFKFAKGTGLMGEAGPEAIMPLTRDSSGRLGVEANGSGSNVEVVVNNYSNAQASTKETTDSRGNRRIEVTVGDMVSGEVQRNGSATQKSIKGTFGLQPQLIRR